MARYDYMSGAALKKASLTTKITDISDSAQSSLFSSFYVHSKVRNFYNNRRYVNASALSNSIDKKLESEFSKTIRQAKKDEQEIYKSLHVSNIKEMQEIFNLDNFQAQFNDNLSIDGLLNSAINAYKRRSQKDTITSEQLGRYLEKVCNSARQMYSDTLFSYRDKILGSSKKGGSAMLTSELDRGLSKVLKSIKDNKSIDIEDLLKTPGKYINNISTWQGVSGEVAQYIAGLENQYIDYVFGELTDQLSDKKNKTDVKLVTTDNITINLSVKNYRTIENTNQYLSLNIHQGQNLQDFIKSIAKAGNISKKSTIDYFIYNLVNILAFTRAGGVDVNDTRRVDKRSEEEFSTYSEYMHIIRKTAMYWIGYDYLNDSDLVDKINFMVINGTIIPVSEILTSLKRELIDSTAKIHSHFSGVPGFGPTVLWQEKAQIIQTLPPMYSGEKRNYPGELIQLGSTIGQAIAAQTRVNIKLSIAVNRLIDR